MKKSLDTVRFGAISYSSQDLIRFQKGLPGFEGLKRFLLVEGEEFAPLKFFQAVDDPNISFPLLRPHAARPTYRFDLPEERVRELELENPEEAAVFCVVTIGSDPEKSTINLFAPIVINLLKRQAAQVILFGSDYKVDERLF